MKESPELRALKKALAGLQAQYTKALDKQREAKDAYIQRRQESEALATRIATLNKAVSATDPNHWAEKAARAEKGTRRIAMNLPDPENVNITPEGE